MKKVRKITLLLLSLMAVQAVFADDYDLYLLGLEDAGYTSLDFVRLQSLSFTQTREPNDEGVTVYVNRMYANYADGTSKTFDLSHYSAIQFETTAVGIHDISLGREQVRPFLVEGTQLSVAQKGTLSVNSLDGRTLYVRSVSAGEHISVQSLPAGIYIVNLGGQSAKILVK